MGSLSNCIKKAGKAISPSEAAELQAARKELIENGMNGQEATEKAITEMITSIEQERADLAAKIEAKGGFVEPIAKYEVKPAVSAEQPRPAANVEPVAETPKETKLENFGEALPPARRNTSLSRDLTDEDIKSLPLSKIWPADEIDQIEDKYTAALAYAIREEIPSKPRVSYKLKRWVEQVKAARDMAKRFIEIVGKDDLDAKMRASSSQLAGFSAKVTVLNEIDRSDWKRVGEVKEYPDAYTYKDGVEIKSPFVSVTIDGKQAQYNGAKSIADVIEKVKESISGKKADSAPRMQFEVRTNSQTKKSFINKKGDREYRKLAEFDDVKSAFAYIKSNYDDLVSAWEGVKDKDNVKKTDVRRSENRPRTGKDRRNGKDVTPEMFADVFGFRGVEFGKWVKQGSEGKDRQGLLNQAYDAMLDLAEIVGIPPKAVSLDGTLGLAFGARGAGWAAAHFEPGTLVINLTKTKGAGTFAHEWFHALDNYFSRKRSGETPMRKGLGDVQQAYREGNFITYKPEPMYINKKAPSKAITKADLELRRAQYPDSAYFAAENWVLDPSHPEGVRPAVEKAFAELVKALNESPMAARAKKNDKGSDGYWSRIIERAARSFENYVIAKMTIGGYQNDFLANVVSIDEFARSDGRYPYLLNEEMPPIEKAFDDLFETIEAVETENGIALAKLIEADNAPVASLATARVKKMIAPLQAELKGTPIEVVDSVADLPEVIQKWAKERGYTDSLQAVYHNGKAYVVANHIKSERQVTRAVLHEVVGHAGIKGVLGDKINPVLDQIADSMKGKAQLPNGVDIGKAYGLDWSKPAERREIVEEYIAHLAESGENPGFIRLVAAKIRELLRKIYPALKWTDADIIGLLAQSRKYVSKMQSSGTQSGIAAQLSSDNGKGSPIWEAAVAKGLDMSKAARMERAKAMGFDVDNIAYHATTNDFTAFDPSFIGSNYGLDEEGFFFSSDPEVVSTMETPSANQRMDVYLPSNLKRIEVKGSPTAWLDAQDKQDLFSDAKNDDFAGIAVRNTKTGETTYVVFDPSQIRSINAAFDPDQADSPDIRAKLATMSADFDTIANETMATPASQLPFFKRVWSVIKERYLPESMRELKQGMIDKFHSIETLEKGLFGDLLDGSASALKASYRTQNLGSVVEVAMHKGTLIYRNGSVEIRPGSKGFMQIFKDVSDQQMMREWEVWAAAKRASRLITEGKEKNFSHAQIDTIMNEVNGKAAVKALFERTHAEYQQFNKEMLDFAEQAGLIDATERAVWEKDDYVPFHRVKELDDATGPDGPRKKKGLSGQRSGIQQLTGGAGRISIVESIVLNTSHLIDASFRNIAMQRIADLGEQTGVMTRLKNAPKLTQAELDAKLDEMGYDVAGLDPAKKKALEKLIQQHELKGDGVVSVSVGGKLRTYKVEDPLLFRSIASLGHHGVEGIMHLFRGAKRLLTAAVTADPAFMLRNFVRDSLSTAVTVDAKIKPLASAISKLTGSEDLHWKIMAAGGGGGGFYDTAPDDVRSHLSKLTKTSGVIRTTKDLWEAWQRFGSRFENANRLAVADKLLQDGTSIAEMAHEAQDVMNFTRTGDYTAMKILVEMIPFMNARIQGLDRLWRGAVSNTPQGRQFRKQFWMRGAIITAATLALLAANWDNDDYWALPEWDRDTYYHFFIGDEHLRLPKPFEVGAIFSTIPERALEQMRDDANGKLFAERMLHMVQDTFAVGQIPQLFKPAYEVAANVNSFTDRPIISYGLSFVKPEAQYDPWTSETMRMVADAMPDFAPEWMRSPKKLEHVMRGYFGTMGSYAVGIADWLAVNTMDLPQPAASRVRDWPVLSAFYQTGQGSTKYSGRVYDMSQRVNELQGAIKKYQDEGYKEKAGALKMDNAKKLQARLGLNRAVKQISDYNSLIKKIMNGPYPPDIKRKRIDELQKTKEDFARKTEEKFRMYF